MSWLNIKKYFNTVLLCLVYGSFAYIFWPFKQAIIFAGLFSFALNPLLTKLKRRFHLSDFKAITILVLFLIGILFLPLSFIFIRVASTLGKIDASKITELPIFDKLQYVATTVLAHATDLAQKVGFDLGQIDIQSMTGDLGKSALALGTAIITNIPSFLFQFSVFIAMLYYFLLNQKRLKQNFIEKEFLGKKQVQRLIQLFENVCNTVLVSTVLIALLQATVVAFACFLVGYNDFLIIFMIGFFMAFVPMVGSAPLTLSLIAYSLLSAKYPAAVVLIVAGAIVGILDNVIKTYIFSSKEDSVSPLISLLSIIGALSMFGIMGLFLGPIITELAVQIGKIISEEDSVDETHIKDEKNK